SAADVEHPHPGSQPRASKKPCRQRVERCRLVAQPLGFSGDTRLGEDVRHRVASFRFVEPWCSTWQSMLEDAAYAALTCGRREEPSPPPPAVLADDRRTAAAARSPAACATFRTVGALIPR